MEKIYNNTSEISINELIEYIENNLCEEINYKRKEFGMPLYGE